MGTCILTNMSEVLKENFFEKFGHMREHQIAPEQQGDCRSISNMTSILEYPHYLHEMFIVTAIFFSSRELELVFARNDKEKSSKNLISKVSPEEYANYVRPIFSKELILILLNLKIQINYRYLVVKTQSSVSGPFFIRIVVNDLPKNFHS